MNIKESLEVLQKEEKTAVLSGGQACYCSEQLCNDA